MASDVISADALTRKVGPLPVWAYGVLAGAAIYIYRKYHPTVSPTASTDSPAVANPGASDGSSTGNVGMPATGTPVQQPDTGLPNGSTNPTPADNASWKSLAVAQLLTLNAWSAYQIDNALSAYISGALLDASQQSIVSQAIRMVGPTPVAVPVQNGTATPPVTNTKKASTLQLVPSAVTGIASPTLYAYWNDTTGKGVYGTLELQESKNGTWYDMGTIGTSTGGVGSKKVAVTKGTSRIFRVQIPANNTGYNQVSSSPVTIRA